MGDIIAKKIKILPGINSIGYKNNDIINKTHNVAADAWNGLDPLLSIIKNKTIPIAIKINTAGK